MTRPNTKRSSIFWGHGRQDQVVAYEREARSTPSEHVPLTAAEGEKSVALLRELGWAPSPPGTAYSREVGAIRFENYAGVAHSVSTAEIEDLQGWLVEALGT
jgi:hypothetical protein